MLDFKTPIIICAMVLPMAMCASAAIAIGSLRNRLIANRDAIDGLRHDLIECQARYRECSIENARLRNLVLADQICRNDELDAQDCPMYDTEAPFNCKRDRELRELGLDA